MNKIVERLKKEFSKTPDLIIKEIKLNMFNNLYIIYLETVSGSNKVNDYILKNVIDNKDKINKNNFQNYLAGPNTKEINKYDKIEYFSFKYKQEILYR